MSRSVDTECGFHHEAFFYSDADELLAGTVPFLRAGIEAGEAILVAMPKSSLELLENELGEEANCVRFVNMEQLGRNPARIIPAWHDFVDEYLSDERGVRGIGEPIWPGRTAAEVDECERHESLLNLAFSDAPPWLLMCPYNAAALDDRVLTSAKHNHPILSSVDSSGTRGASCFRAPEGEDAFAGELHTPASAIGLPFGIEQLGEVRHFIAEHGRQAGMDSSRIEDLVLAANEVATNSLRHGGGRGKLSLWREHDIFICDVRDDGHIDQPLVGRERPHPAQPGGRGIWLANQLCDLVQIRVGESGNLVRLQMSLAD